MRTLEDIKGVCGIYAIVHRESGVCYVGCAVDMWRRRQHHRSLLRRGAARRVYVAMREFGEDAFDFVVLERCERAALLARELFHIDRLDATGVNGLNTLRFPTTREPFNIPPETRQRMSDAHKGKERSTAHKAALSAALKGRSLSEAHRKALSLAWRTRGPVSAATREKLSQIGKGKKRPPMTDAHRAAIGLASKSWTRSDEYRKNMSLRLMGRTFSAESLAKMRKPKTKKLSDQPAPAA